MCFEKLFLKLLREEDRRTSEGRLLFHNLECLSWTKVMRAKGTRQACHELTRDRTVPRDNLRNVIETGSLGVVHYPLQVSNFIQRYFGKMYCRAESDPAFTGDIKARMNKSNKHLWYCNFRAWVADRTNEKKRWWRNKEEERKDKRKAKAIKLN